jgi:hypothetical protein
VPSVVIVQFKVDIGVFENRVSVVQILLIWLRLLKRCQLC